MAERRVLSSQLHRLYRRSGRFREPSSRQTPSSSRGVRTRSLEIDFPPPIVFFLFLLLLTQSTHSTDDALLRLFSGVLAADTWPRNFLLLLLRFCFCCWPDFYKLKECVIAGFCYFSLLLLNSPARISIFTVRSGRFLQTLRSPPAQKNA